MAPAGDQDGWGTVVIGDITIKRPCITSLVVVLVQVARLRDAALKRAPGGVYVDCVRLLPAQEEGWDGMVLPAASGSSSRKGTASVLGPLRACFAPV
jgi:hypothetical protein